MQIATMIEKAPQGGYVLKQITFAEGQAQVEVIAYRSTLPEISAYELAMKQMTFKEAAWYAPPVQAEQPRPPMPPPQPEEHIDMPRVAGGPGGVVYQNGEHTDHEVERLTTGLMNRVGRQAATFVAFAFCTGVWLSFNLRGLVT